MGCKNHWKKYVYGRFHKLVAITHQKKKNEKERAKGDTRFFSPCSIFFVIYIRELFFHSWARVLSTRCEFLLKKGRFSITRIIKVKKKNLPQKKKKLLRVAQEMSARTKPLSEKHEIHFSLPRSFITCRSQWKEFLTRLLSRVKAFFREMCHIIKRQSALRNCREKDLTLMELNPYRKLC